MPPLCTSCANEENRPAANLISSCHTSCGSRKSRTGPSPSPTRSSPVKIPLSACEARGLHDNILAAHRRSTLVIGSINTWAEANASEALMSSTPADAELGVPNLAAETIQPFTDLTNSTDSDLQIIRARDSVCTHQVMLSRGN